MIDTKRYRLLEGGGYINRPDAYEKIRFFYGNLQGVTTFFDNGKWFIVQSRASC